MSAFPIKANGVLYDTAQAEEHINTLFRHVDWQPGEIISLLGIGEKGTAQEGIFRDRQMIPPAFIGVVHGHLRRWAEHHVAGFIVPAVLHGAAQEKGNVKLEQIAMLTAILLDLDSGDIGAKASFAVSRLGAPTLTIASGGVTETGEVKRHLYWLLNEPSEEVERVAALRKLLAAKVGGDQSFGRATQVVRVAGTVHAKNGKAAVCSIIGRAESEYNLDDLAEIIEGMEPMPGIEVAAPSLPMLSVVGGMDFTPRQDTAVAALHRDIHEGGDDLTRFSEFSKVAGFNISEVRAGRLTPEAAYLAMNGWVLVHMIPPWPQVRINSEFQALINKDVENHGPFPQSIAANAVASATEIKPTRATWPEPHMIPPRPWLFGRWIQRGTVTAVIAPGGVGKSSLIAAMSLSMASGKPILGKTVYDGPLRVWSWNLEDSGDNLARARIAASIKHGICEVDCGGRLFVDSGPEGATLCLAIEDRTGFQIIEPVVDNLIAAILEQQIDVLIIDPFVSSHAVNENDNNKVDAVVKRYAYIAIRTGCAIVLVHHSAKLRGEAVTAESSRGASALNNAARATLVLNRMTPEQADKWRIEYGTEARYFSVADDKHNMAPAEAADWFKIESVDLNNGNEIHGADSIGVVTRWEPPQAMDGVNVSHLVDVQRVLAQGTHWHDEKGTTKKDWAGEVVARIMQLDPEDKADRLKILGIIKTWLKNGALKTETVMENGRARKRLVPGEPVIGHQGYRPQPTEGE